MSCEHALNVDQWKTFSENYNESLLMACLQIYRELLLLTTFLRVHSNSKEVSYLSWQNTYSSLETTCHIKLTFFLLNEVLENLLLANYLISVTAPLISISHENTTETSLTSKKCRLAKFCKVDARRNVLLFTGEQSFSSRFFFNIPVISAKIQIPTKY